jgi:hypothetical protein
LVRGQADADKEEQKKRQAMLDLLVSQSSIAIAKRQSLDISIENSATVKVKVTPYLSARMTVQSVPEGVLNVTKFCVTSEQRHELTQALSQLPRAGFALIVLNSIVNSKEFPNVKFTSGIPVTSASYQRGLEVMTAALRKIKKLDAPPELLYLVIQLLHLTS